ncbi:MAG: hypothetical protein AB1656_11830 [Candidatus Omnitrophota bacterium]
MPKKKSLWKRDTKCLTCEGPMFNYQFITKSQTIVMDEWMVAHTQPVGEYDEYPDVLKTTICPTCFTASNEYSFGVDKYTMFFRSPSKHNQIKEFFNKTTRERFQVLVDAYSRFEKESAMLDKKNNRPANTRTKATFEKIWQNKEKFGLQFFTLMFAEPRDYITAIACFAVDRYCQLLRIAYNYDVEPAHWDYVTLKNAVEMEFSEKTLDMKSPEPRFYFIGANYLQTIQFLQELMKTLEDENEERYKDLIEEYWNEAYNYMKMSFRNDDLSAIPSELKDGGMNLLMAKFHYRFKDDESGDKCLRYARNYADNRLKQISSTNQQNFVNEVDALWKERFPPKEEEEAAEDPKKKKKK